MTNTASTPTRDAAAVLRDDDAYTDFLIDLVTVLPSSCHTTAEVAHRLEEADSARADKTTTQQEDLPRHGYITCDGVIAAWALPETLSPGAGVRIVGAHINSLALKLKPAAALVRSGWQLVNTEVYGGSLLASLLGRELGLAGHLTTRNDAIHLVHTGPIARVAQIAPHLNRSVNNTPHLGRQTHLLPLWSLAGPDTIPSAIETHLCEIAGVEPIELAGHNILIHPAQMPTRFSRGREFLVSSRLNNFSFVHAGLVALGAFATAETGPVEPITLIAFDHEEIDSDTHLRAGGPFLETLPWHLAHALGVSSNGPDALLTRSICLSANAGHSVHPVYTHLHDPAVQPLINHGPLLKINAQQCYAIDAAGAAIWARACTAAGMPSQDFVSNSAMPCDSTIGPVTATRLGITTVDVGAPLSSMYSARKMGGVKNGPWPVQALHAYWQGA